MKKLLIIFLISSVLTNLKAQNIFYSTAFIPDSLLKNANAVIRKNDITLQIFDISNITYKVHYAITILNPIASDLANILIYYDSFSKVNNIIGTVYDKNGNKVKKIKKSEIQDYSTFADFSLIDDSRIKYYTPLMPTCPFTIEYEYLITYSTSMFYPQWYIFPDYKVSVQSSSYNVISDEKYYRYFEKNFDDKFPITKTNYPESVKWRVSNLKAVEKEPYSPDYTEFMPILYFAPNNFKMEGYTGNMENWQNFGKWIYELNSTKNNLSDETKSKIKLLIANTTDTIEMVKILYEYMQSKTRYVSIQLGIGGFQPFESKFVDEKGYGDCKALSNYMYSILDAAGIKSNYILVRAGEDAANIMTEFTLSQFNHATLCVPINNDTIWLECTSQKMPFGFIGTFTDNRDVLLITDDGGKIVHTKEYKQSENIKSTKAIVKIDSIGAANAEINIKYSGLKYDDAMSYLYLTTDEQKKQLYETIDIADFQILNYKITENKALIPSINQELNISSNNYATLSGKRMFLTLNMLSKITEAPTKVDFRQTEVEIKRGYIDSDTIEYEIPQSFKIEYLTTNQTIDSDFGNYKIEISKSENKIMYIRTLTINKGNYPAEKYEDLIDFIKQIIKLDAEKIVILR